MKDDEISKTITYDKDFFIYNYIVQNTLVQKTPPPSSRHSDTYCIDLEDGSFIINPNRTHFHQE